MKRIVMCLIGICLLSLVDSRVSRADMILGPQIPERTTQRRTESIPLYAVSAGIVAVALTGSLIALRVIRKRNDKPPQ
jgi:hypothetical protein